MASLFTLHFTAQLAKRTAEFSLCRKNSLKILLSTLTACMSPGLHHGLLRSNKIKACQACYPSVQPLRVVVKKNGEEGVMTYHSKILSLLEEGECNKTTFQWWVNKHSNKIKLLNHFIGQMSQTLIISKFQNSSLLHNVTMENVDTFPHFPHVG